MRYSSDREYNCKFEMWSVIISSFFSLFLELFMNTENHHIEKTANRDGCRVRSSQERPRILLVRKTEYVIRRIGFVSRALYVYHVMGIF